MNNETLLIVSIGLCLGMVVLATYTGFSTALGAFIMGSILAETIEAEHIEHIIQPVKRPLRSYFFRISRYAGESGGIGRICLACYHHYSGYHYR